MGYRQGLCQAMRSATQHADRGAQCTVLFAEFNHKRTVGMQLISD